MSFDLTSIQKSKKPTTQSSRLDHWLKKDIKGFGRTFNNKVKEAFYTELAVLLKAGVQLKQALELIKASHKKKAIVAALQDNLQNIVEGKSLSETVKGKKDFTAYEYHSLKIGEETGNLIMVLEQLAEYYTKRNEQHRQLVSALTYPVIILSTAILVVIFMLSYVVPMFQDIFKQQNVELPAITKFIIDCAAVVSNQGVKILFFFVILFFGISHFKHHPWFKKRKDDITLRIPVLGRFLKTAYLAQFTQAMSLLTASKVPVVHAIGLVKQMLNFYPLQSALEQAERELIQGETISNSLKQHAIFDNKMIALINVAEETNQTEFIFNKLNQQYNTQLNQQSKMLSTIMEPFIIIFVGGVVGVILIAMYLPMFRLSSVLG